MFENTSLQEIAAYHSDCQAALYLFFSEVYPDYQSRFFGYTKDETTKELQRRLAETNTRSALVVMARVEATFRVDYKLRAQRKLPDDVSIEFRKIWKRRAQRAHLDEDIVAVWMKNIDNIQKNALGKMKTFFKMRNWIAHGRYWQFAVKYDYVDVYNVADYILTEFPFET